MTDSLQPELTALRVAVERLDKLRLAAPPPQPSAQDDLDVAGLRVLVVGPNARDEALALADRSPAHVLACEPVDASQDPDEGPGTVSLEVRRCDWESLDPRRDGTFELVHCDGLLHRVLEPMALLHRLRAMTADDGTLVIGSMLLADPERSELLRFVPDRHAGDPSWWFVPGRLAFRWMVMTAGFEIQAELDEREGPSDGFAVVHGYLQATPTGRAAAANTDYVG